MANNKNTNEQQFFKELCSYSGREIDLAVKAYHLISISDNPIKLFRSFMEKTDISFEGKKKIESIWQLNELDLMEKNNAKLIEGILDKLIAENMEQEAFYDKLWSKINSEDLFATEKEKIFAFYKVWINSRLPYYKLESGLKMDNESFKKITAEKEDDIKKAFYIINARLEQKTEVSSLLLRIIESGKDEAEKAVILAHVLQGVRKNLFEKLLQGDSEKVQSDEDEE